MGTPPDDDRPGESFAFDGPDWLWDKAEEARERGDGDEEVDVSFRLGFAPTFSDPDESGFSERVTMHVPADWDREDFYRAYYSFARDFYEDHWDDDGSPDGVCSVSG